MFEWQTISHNFKAKGVCRVSLCLLWLNDITTLSKETNQNYSKQLYGMVMDILFKYKLIFVDIKTPTPSNQILSLLI